MRELAVLVLGALIAGAVAMVAISAPPAYSEQKEPRFPLLKYDELDAQQKPVADEILKVSSIGLSGPYNPMMRSPILADRMFKLLDYVRFNTSVPRRLNEFAILIEARLWTSQVEWYAHYPMALKAGLSQSVADELKEGKRPSSMKPDEAIVYDLLMELATKHFVSDATFQRAREVFTQQQVVDLVMVSGIYVSMAMVSNMSEEGVPPGKTPPLQPLPSNQ
ncbi:MAG: carboxymuconolactone decarboxylase family protein [Candidatus Acidiferrales bacterium]